MFRIGPPPLTPPNDNVVLPDPDPGQAAAFESERAEMRSMLFDPLYAFAASWHYSRNLLLGAQRCSAPKSSSRYNCRFCSAPESSAVRSFKVWDLHFGGALNALCWAPDLEVDPSLGGKSKNGLEAFWVAIGKLLDSWLPLRTEPNAVLLWCDSYPDLVADMNRAQMARVAWLKRPNYFELEVKNPGLITGQRLRGQRTYSQAGKTAAYVLWGEFLAKGSSSIDFCEKCLQKSEMTLRSRIASGRRRDLLHNIATGRWLTRFIRAASLPPGSSEFQVQRDKLLDLCWVNEIKEADRALAEKTLDQFLKDIAESRPYIPTD